MILITGTHDNPSPSRTCIRLPRALSYLLRNFEKKIQASDAWRPAVPFSSKFCSKSLVGNILLFSAHVICWPLDDFAQQIDSHVNDLRSRNTTVDLPAQVPPFLYASVITTSNLCEPILFFYCYRNYWLLYDLENCIRKADNNKPYLGGSYCCSYSLNLLYDLRTFAPDGTRLFYTVKRSKPAFHFFFFKN